METVAVQQLIRRINTESLGENLMTTQTPCVQIFEDVPEAISSVSLRRDLARGTHIALMRFQALASLDHFLSYRKSSVNSLHLIEPSSIKMLYGEPEGEDLKDVECELEIARDDH